MCFKCLHLHCCSTFNPLVFCQQVHGAPATALSALLLSQVPYLFRMGLFAPYMIFALCTIASVHLKGACKLEAGCCGGCPGLLLLLCCVEGDLWWECV